MCMNIWFVFFSFWLISLCIKALGSSISVQFSSVAQSCLTLRPHGLQHARPPCPPPTPGVNLNSCPLSRWCHPWWYEKASPQFNWLNFFPFYGCVIFHWIYVPQLLYSFLSGPLGCFRDGGGEGGRSSRERICMHFWLFHMYGRKQHNIVKQFSSNEI